MKKTIKRILSFVLCTLIAMTAVGVCVAGAEDYTYSGTVIYLSDKGDDTKDGKTSENAVKTMEKAAGLAGEGGTVVITDEYTHTGAIPACTVAGLNADSTYNLKDWRLDLGGNVTLKNIKLKVFENWSYILCNGYKLVVDENVVTERNTGVNKFPGIRGGGDKKAVNGNTEIVIKSGEWNAVAIGTRLAKVNGNGHLTIHEKAVVNSIVFGSEAGDTEYPFVGASTVKFVGGNANVAGISDFVDNIGKCYVDISEFTGKLPSFFEEKGAIILKTASEIPAEAKPGAALTQENIERAEKGEFFSGKVALGPDYSGLFDLPAMTYDLSGVKNPVYISDMGNDANSGKSKDKPVKTLAAAANVVGEEGGTLVVTGTYTYDGKAFSVPLNITSTCSKDIFVINSWALRVNNTTIENVNMVVAADWSYILHGGTPLVIGDNVNFALKNGVTKFPSIRAEEGGNKALTDITINGGNFHYVMTGTKNGTVEGDAKITVNGGTIKGITFGGEGEKGGVKGSSTVKISGDAKIEIINNTKASEGELLLDLSDYKGGAITYGANMSDVTVIEAGNKLQIPLNEKAQFIDGYPDKTFLPDKPMTRAEAIKVLAVICGHTSSFDASKVKTAFSDLPAEEWYTPYVKYLEKYKLLSFYGNTLEPTKEIARGEFVKLISSITEEAAGKASFPDVQSDHPYYKEIINAANAGLVEGNPDGTFAPDATLTRAQIVTIFNRLLGRTIVEANALKIEEFTDISGHWAKKQIIAASHPATYKNTILWYNGNTYAENSPVDVSKLKFDTTNAILSGIDKTDAAAVEKAIEDYSAKRIEEIRNAVSNIKPATGGKTYYVSSSTGNDANDGLTQETAWATLSKVSSATLKRGDVVYFKRGDIFRGQLTTKYGVKYTAYGEGEKPKLYGSKQNYAEDKGFWLPTGNKNVYVSSQTFSSDIGLIVFNEGEAWTIKKTEGINGALTTKDLEMNYNKSDKKIYLYSESDPNTRFNSAEIVEDYAIISGNGTNVTIDNLCLMYGNFGIGFNGVSNVTVQNCEIGWIGGCLQREGNDPVRYGNAIELYSSGSKFTVENCYIYQVYDAGVTFQYFGADTSATRDFKDIKYIDNVITHSTYAIEYRNDMPEGYGIMKNIEISGNVMTHTGDGWGNQRPDRNNSLTATIKGWGGDDDNHSEDFVIYDNVIAATHENAALIHIGIDDAADMPELTGNLFFGKEGNIFGIYGLDNDTSKDHIKYNDTVASKTVGLDDNTFVVAK